MARTPARSHTDARTSAITQALTRTIALALVASLAAPRHLPAQAPTLGANDARHTVERMRDVVDADVTRTPGTAAKEPLVEFEMMTWQEVKQALADGKKTALIYTGGTEQRGPQNVNGGHTLMGRATVKAIALALGNAIAMPVLPYTPNNASATLPGTIGLTPELLSAILERITEQTIATGFTSVILMGDHGGGQPAAYQEVAKKLDEKYAPQGIHVYFCDEVYAKANGDFDKWLTENGYPVSSHAGIPDTSEMLYLGGDLWVRKDLVKTALGDPVAVRGQPRDPNAQRINNGISGDARRSTAELGKRIFDMKVQYAVKQIKSMLNMPAGN